MNTGSIVDTNSDWVLQGTTLVQDTSAVQFHIRPKTELTVTKEYCGMNGDCANPQHPYGQWYDGRQKVGYRLSVYNSGNTAATGLRLEDVLPAQFS